MSGLGTESSVSDPRASSPGPLQSPSHSLASLPAVSDGSVASAPATVALFSFGSSSTNILRQWKAVKKMLIAAAKSVPAEQSRASLRSDSEDYTGSVALQTNANPMTAKLRKEDVAAVRALFKTLNNSTLVNVAVTIKMIDTLAELLIFRRSFGRTLRILLISILLELWTALPLIPLLESSPKSPQALNKSSMPQFLRVNLKDQTIDPIIDGALFSSLLTAVQEPSHPG